MSLILWGPTKLGKTLWARSLSKHAYFGGLFSLDEPLDGVEHAIFDDINGGLEFFHNYKSWLGGQKEFYATDKYRHKKLITWGKPCIWIANENPRYNKGVDVEWLEGNCVFIEVNEWLARPKLN